MDLEKMLLLPIRHLAESNSWSSSHITLLEQHFTTFTGQNIGAGKVDRVKQGHRVGVICVIAFSILMLIPGQFFGKQIMGIFVQDADVIAIGAKRILQLQAHSTHFWE